MQASCTQCGAVYEFDAALIPSEGYDAQCTTCQQIFFVRPEAPAQVNLLTATCDQCGAHYQFGAHEIPAQGYDAQCTRCQHVFFVSPDADTVPAPQHTPTLVGPSPLAQSPPAEQDSHDASAFAPVALGGGTLVTAPNAARAPQKPTADNEPPPEDLTAAAEPPAASPTPTTAAMADAPPTPLPAASPKPITAAVADAPPSPLPTASPTPTTAAMADAPPTPPLTPLPAASPAPTTGAVADAPPSPPSASAVPVTPSPAAAAAPPAPAESPDTALSLVSPVPAPAVLPAASAPPAGATAVAALLPDALTAAPLQSDAAAPDLVTELTQAAGIAPEFAGLTPPDPRPRPGAAALQTDIDDDDFAVLSNSEPPPPPPPPFGGALGSAAPAPRRPLPDTTLYPETASTGLTGLSRITQRRSHATGAIAAAALVAVLAVGVSRTGLWRRLLRSAPSPEVTALLLRGEKALCDDTNESLGAALDAFAGALARAPDSADAHALQAVAHALHGTDLQSQAQQALHDLQSKQQDLRAVHPSRSGTAAQASKLEALRRELLEAVQNGHRLLDTAAHEADLSRTQLEQASALDDANPMLHQAKALVLALSLSAVPANLEKARAALEQANLEAAAGTPGGLPPGWLYFAQGLVFGATADGPAHEQAKRALRQAIEQEPRLLRARLFLAQLQARDGQRDEAQRGLSDLLAAVPNYAKGRALQEELAASGAHRSEGGSGSSSGSRASRRHVRGRHRHR